MRSFVLIGAALSTLTACGPACKNAQNPPTYTADITPIYAKHCNVCHSSNPTVAQNLRGNVPLDANFDQYAEAKAYANDASSQVASEVMPPAIQNDALTADQKTTIEQWAVCGAKQ